MSPIKTSTIGNVILLLFVVGLLIGTYFTAQYFRTQEENVRAENPVFFCQPLNAPLEEQTCYFTTHEHLYLTVVVFGEEKTIPFEHGDLHDHHTHAEKNKIHWHKLVEVPRGSKERPVEEFTLGKTFDDLDIRLTEKCIFDHCNGDINPQTGQPATLEVLVNGQRITQFRDYVWRDKDHVEVRFH